MRFALQRKSVAVFHGKVTGQARQNNHQEPQMEMHVFCCSVAPALNFALNLPDNFYEINKARRVLFS